MTQTVDASQHIETDGRSLNLGEFAHRTIQEQYQRIIKRESRVLADKSPDHLHQMRVSIRRLRTALRVFDMAIELPKAAQDKRLRALARVLGRLRDLDVQIATLTQDYQPRLSQSEQDLLQEGVTALQKQRRKAFAGTEDTLTRSSYQSFKSAYEEWIDHPRFKPVAQLAIATVLPDLLNPLLSRLLLHPGWLIATEEISPDNSPTLHDLRKVCKQVRYQAEFFADFYPSGFKAWIDEIRELQDGLGKVQDGQVLLTLLQDKVPQSHEMPELHATIQQEQEMALHDWNRIRQQYLDPEFRQQLYQQMLQPYVAPNC